jgi:hypothetical protein
MISARRDEQRERQAWWCVMKWMTKGNDMFRYVKHSGVDEQKIYSDETRSMQPAE